MFLDALAFDLGPGGSVLEADFVGAVFGLCGSSLCGELMPNFHGGCCLLIFCPNFLGLAGELDSTVFWFEFGKFAQFQFLRF